MPKGLTDEPQNTVAYDSRNEARYTAKAHPPFDFDHQALLLSFSHSFLFRKRARARKSGSKVDRPDFKSKDWVLKKKERQRKQGKSVRPDSKYTARKRPTSF